MHANARNVRFRLVSLTNKNNRLTDSTHLTTLVDREAIHALRSNNANTQNGMEAMQLVEHIIVAVVGFFSPQFECGVWLTN